MVFHMKFAAEKLVYHSKIIPLDRIDMHSNRADRACAIKLSGFDDESIGRMGIWFPLSKFSWNTFNSGYRGSLNGCEPKRSGLKYLRTWKVRKIIQGKNFVHCTGGGNITIATST